MKRDTLPQVTIRATKPVAKKVVEKKSVLKTGGTVPTRKIDSIRQANPKLGASIGKPYKGSGGMDTYGDDASDKIKRALKPKR